MKRLIQHFVKVEYSYEKTQKKTKRLNKLITFSFKNTTFFLNINLQLCLIKNKILPFFENMPKNKLIKPLFYSNNIHTFENLKGISHSCNGLVVAGKWIPGFINIQKKNVIISDTITYSSRVNMLIVTYASFCRNAIKEAHKEKIVSFGCVGFGDTSITDVTYFIMGVKNNLEFSIKFCLLLSCMVRWKTHENICLKIEQTNTFIKHKNYIQKLKIMKEKKEVSKNLVLVKGSNSRIKNNLEWQFERRTTQKKIKWKF